MAHLNEAAVANIKEICDRYANEPTPLMMILSDIQKEYGYNNSYCKLTLSADVISGDPTTNSVDITEARFVDKNDSSKVYFTVPIDLTIYRFEGL